MKKRFGLCVLTLLLLTSCTFATPEQSYGTHVATCEEHLAALFNEAVNDNLVLPQSYSFTDVEVLITWHSSDESVMDQYGNISKKAVEQTVTMTATLIFPDYQKALTFYVTISAIDVLQQALDSIVVPTYAADSFYLPVQTVDGYVISWRTDDANIVNNRLIIESTSAETINLVAKVQENDKYKEKSFVINVNLMAKRTMTGLSYAKDWESYNMENLEIVNDKVMLQPGATTGQYESPVIEVASFNKLVGSWSAITTTTANVEVLFKVRVNNQWSGYLSYSKWGLGLQNRGVSVTESMGIAKMSTDELMVLNGKTADALQFKVILTRTLTDSAPVVSLVGYALNYLNYESSINLAYLPSSIVYDVPELNQNIVPTIGNSICSPTSVTMLLKYKGEDFSAYDTYEHRYIANLARDYGHSIYGNWVYNVAVMGAYGYDAYVAQFANVYELAYHLATVGPVAISVKGDMQGLYTTGGHLLVVKGYTINNQRITFICNDPNLKNVEVEYTQTTIEAVWRNISYVII